jgi:hypothetical protein
MLKLVQRQAQIACALQIAAAKLLFIFQTGKYLAQNQAQ